MKNNASSQNTEQQPTILWRNYETRYATQQDVLNYITMWYNSHRLHSYLDYQSPNGFESVERKLEMVA